ncbi:MAG TPA: glycosyltransferase [Acidobacteriaceae bacterium]|jgi:glycosyltransferase involved in cell wall biosynthesis
MRILHVIGSLSPADGGPPEAVRQLARAYPKIGVDVEVLCQDSPDSPFLASLPFPVHALGQRWLGRFGLSPRLWRWLHQNAARFDGIVMNGLWIFADIAVRSAARRAATPYAVFPHGSLDPWFNRKYPLKHLKKLLYWPLQYPVLRDARAVLFTTATERDLAATSFRPSRWNGVPVSYGISDPAGDPASQIEAFHAQFPALRGRRFLLFMSRLHEKKGCDLLVEAFARLASKFPDVDLVVAGPDQVGLQAKLQERATRNGISSRVHWPGMLTGDLKWGALRSAEAFVLPSHQENFGIVVAESLAAGRPVLISNQVNIWPDIQADGAGLVDDDTLEGTERLLHRWLQLPPAEREAMAARAWPCFSSRYSMERAASSIKALFAGPSRSSRN